MISGPECRVIWMIQGWGQSSSRPWGKIINNWNQGRISTCFGVYISDACHAKCIMTEDYRD